MFSIFKTRPHFWQNQLLRRIFSNFPQLFWVGAPWPSSMQRNICLTWYSLLSWHTNTTFYSWNSLWSCAKHFSKICNHFNHCSYTRLPEFPMWVCNLGFQRIMFAVFGHFFGSKNILGAQIPPFPMMSNNCNSKLQKHNNSKNSQQQQSERQNFLASISM